MATKTITITLDAYKKLRAKKASNESFTDIILKLTGKKNTLDYIRSLETSTELADNIEKTMQETRKAKLREADAVSPLLMASLYSRRMQNIFRWF